MDTSDDWLRMKYRCRLRRYYSTFAALSASAFMRNRNRRNSLATLEGTPF